MVEVSVVVPTYERPEQLPGALKTALGQTVDSLEVVVVDDGSTTDYAAETVAGYERARCIRHDQNRGVAAARNTGIEAASGAYVAFLDDDDRWHKRKIERQLVAMNECPDAGLATTLMVSVNPDGEILTCEGAAPEGDLSEPVLINSVVGSPSRVLVRAEALDGRRFDTNLPTTDDWDLFLRLCQQWHVTLVPEPFYVRVVHESLSSAPQDAERDRMAVIRKHESRIRDHGVWNRTTAAYHTNVGRKYLATGEHEQARRHLRRAVGQRPTWRRVALLGLTLVPQRGVTGAIDLKRRIEARWNGCPDSVALSQSVPGFPGEAP
jgi:glycosyltransferase involved in cell wall biosynthesis